MSKTLVLDYSTWRCGGNRGKNKLGKGSTYLVNDQGFMCCLGQFTPQLNPSITPKQMKDCGEPDQINEDIPVLTKERDEEQDTIVNSELSTKAMTINDDEDTTPEEKIQELQYLFKEEGYEIQVVNKPEKG